MFKSVLTGDLATRLQALPGAVSGPIQLRALKAGAEPIRARMAALAPRSSPDAGKPGHMADHIVVSVVRKVDGEALGDGQAAVAVGPSKEFFWAGEHEYGPRDGRYSAHPFARPAFDGEAGNAIKAVIDELWDGLRAAAEKGFGQSFTFSSTSAPSTPLAGPGGAGVL